MPVSVPTPEQLKRIAAQMHLSLTDSDIASFIALMKPSIDGYNVVDQLPDNLPAVRYPRTPAPDPHPKRTSTTPGTTRPGSTGRRRASSRARGWS